MVKNEIQMTSEKREWFDKKQIALAIRNSTLDDKMGCSLLSEGIIKYCEGCSLKCICDLIDEVREVYIEETTNVISTFRVD
ncbi:hypothetical protein DIC82_18015 [Clostridium beijerinckii]|nr:hypothetical protein DIC82_18015 [Clostridium beijerinckii]